MTAKQLRLGLGVAIVASLLVVSLALATSSAPGHRLRSGPMRLVRGSVEPRDGYVRASTLVRPGKGRAALTAAVSAPLVGPLAPAAVASDDGRYVAYNTWLETRPVDSGLSFSRQGIQPGDPVGTPSVRVVDTRASRDMLVDRGAYSPAWRADGALAYARGVDDAFRPSRPYLTDVAVRRSLDARPVAWTNTPDRYVVYAWARDRLLVYRLGDDEQIETLVLDAPGQMRSLGAGSVVAISPDGREAFLLGPDDRTVRVVRVADGSEVATLGPDAAGSSYDWLLYSGSWVGDEVVAAGSRGLVVFHVDESSISVEQVLDLDRSAIPAGVQEPVLGGADAGRITATADVPPQAGQPAQTFLIDCDRVTRTCLRGDAAPPRDWLRLVENPSRPFEVTP